jgi:hypothetical protein
MSRKEDFDKFKVGTKVKFIEEWESFPHFHVKNGLSGKVVRNDCMGIAIKMDEKLDGAEYWDNEVHFYFAESMRELKTVEEVHEHLLKLQNAKIVG